ncbi:hypothetical protein [Alistipes sp. i18-0019-D1]|uniref:hypothetical protein n=1 Tax=Alistipes sp. i18-0019-D1 TaxID=3132707 RepID=UPI0036F3F8E7
MGRYTVITGQNLYDVALDIYGSIEGITDLLLSNPALSMMSELRAGQVLDYSDGVLIDAETVAYLRREGIVPASGERHVYFKEAHFPRLGEFRLPPAATGGGFSLAGEGAVEIDWGDNTPLQTVALSTAGVTLHHTFDNAISTPRILRIYGDARLQRLDLTELHPSAAHLLRPVYVESLTLGPWQAPLALLPLCEGLCELDLRGAACRDLSPLVPCRGLMRLDLSHADMQRPALDGYLIALVREHYGRRACRVTLTGRPSGEYREPMRDEDRNYILTSGMEAVWLLTHEPSWNEGGPWRFDICGEEYIYEPYPDPEPETDFESSRHSGGAVD